MSGFLSWSKLGMRSTPWLSIIVPSYNRPKHAIECINSLMSQNVCDEHVEIVFVDDGSSEMVHKEQLIAFGGLSNFHYLRQNNTGPSAARNAGASLARGEFLVFLDDDCRASKHWLKRLSEACRDAPDVLIGGRIKNACTEHACSEASQLLVDFLYVYFDPSQGRTRFFCSSNICVSRAAFLETGGFDTRFIKAAAEDRHFCLRWCEAHGSTIFAARVLVTHHHELTLTQFARQHSNYGAGAYRLKIVRDADGESVPSLEPFSFYRGMLQHVWQHGTPGRRGRLITLVLFAQVCNVWGYLCARSSV